MADIDKSTETVVQAGTFGNSWNVHAQFVPTAATTAGDKALLGILPAGTKLLDAFALIEDAVASLTLSLGFRYVNGESGSDEAFFMDGADVAAGGKFRAGENNPPAILQYDAYLVATLGGAVFATTNRLDVVVNYDYIGPVTEPA